MKGIPKISDSEWEVMRVVWARHPIAAAEIIEQLGTVDRRWHPKTVRTLLARLVTKQALKFTPRGNLYFYEPLVAEHDCVLHASDTFLARVFAGSLRPMLAHFVEQRRLTKADLEDLRQLLEQSESANRKPLRKKP